MSNSQAPTNGYYNGAPYNPNYFAEDSSGSTITVDYLQSNYLQRTGDPTDIATVTTFTGQINSTNATNATSGTTGAIYTSGGIGSTLDLFTGSGNLTTNATMSNIFPTCNNVNLGNQSYGTVTMCGAQINTILDVVQISTQTLDIATSTAATITCSEAHSAQVFLNATTVAIGNQSSANVEVYELTANTGNLTSLKVSGQVNSTNATNATSGTTGAIYTSGGIGSTLDLFTGSGNLTTSATTSNLVTNATSVNLGNQSSGTITMSGAGIGTLDISANPAIITCNEAHASGIFFNATSVEIGNQTTGTVTACNLVTNTGNLNASSLATTGNVFNQTNVLSLNLGDYATTVNLGATTGTCNINNATVTLPNATQLNLNNAKLFTNSAINSSSAQTIFNSGGGYTGGAVYCSQPFQGSTFKMVVMTVGAVYTSGSSWYITYTFPTAFTSNSTMFYILNDVSGTINVQSTYIEFGFPSGSSNVQGGILIYGF